MEHHRIRYGRHIIGFRLEYRKRKSLEISVYPDLSVGVVAPIEKTYEQVEQRVRSRAFWILEQKHFFSMFLPKQPEKRFVGGESFYYLGRQYMLKITESENEYVVLKHGIINVFVKNRSNCKKVEELLESWYRSKAELKFNERLAICYEKIKKYGIDLPELKIRKMTKRWGSCSKDGAVILNTELIKAPSHCIDYVIIHEICHIKYFNHGKAFYNLLVQVMPDWQKRKKRLEQVL